MKKGVLLTTKTCIKCASIKEEFNANRIDNLDIVDAMSNPWIDIVRENSINTVPTLLVYEDGTLITIDNTIRSLSDIIKIIGG